MKNPPQNRSDGRFPGKPQGFPTFMDDGRTLFAPDIADKMQILPRYLPFSDGH
jgi:hypothetical protein